MRRRTPGPASPGLGEGLAGQYFLGQSRSSNVHSVSSDTRMAGFRVKWVKWAMCQEAVRLGWVVFEDARLKTFASPESVRELQRWDKNITNNWIP